MIYTLLFNKLNNNIVTIGANTVSSGNALESTKRPLIYIEQQSRILIEKDSCNQRQEEILFEIHVVARTFSKLDSILSEIETVLDWSNLNEDYDTASKTLLTVEWQGRERGELFAGRFEGSVSYRILVETAIGDRLLTDTTSGSNIFKNLYDRYNTHSQLKDLVNDFTAGEFVNEKSKRPFIFTEGFNTRELTGTTCSRQEIESFSLIVDEFLPSTVETILDEIMNVFDYCKLTSSDRTFMLMEWVGSELFELKSNLWRGKINYELTHEKLVS